jgi:hypothetical protein
VGGLAGEEPGARRWNPVEKGGTPVKAVRFDEYGGVDVLKAVDVPRPVPGRARSWSRSRQINQCRGCRLSQP